MTIRGFFDVRSDAGGALAGDGPEESAFERLEG
jgi:hypothetical protein